MKFGAIFAITVLAAALPALAAPTCNPGQVVQGDNCTLSVALGWAAAGLGNDSILTIYVPPNASGPVAFHITALTSSLGSAYTGYFGIKVSDAGEPESVIVTLSDIVAGAPGDIGALAPGEIGQFSVTQVCWDPSCTAPAPAGAVPNMFSLQILIASPNPTDVNPNDVQGTVRFLNGSRVTFQTTETAVRSNAPYNIIPGVNLGAKPEGRYVQDGAAWTMPFDAISISNLNNMNAISGTVTLQDLKGSAVATASIPSIPAGGAAGYLLIGRTPGDALGLLPSSTVLPAGDDGVFHGILVIGLNGLTVGSQGIVLAQEYNGNSMLNLPIFHSPVP